jgi:plasmid maintenance system antidote protein VapI
MSLLEIQQRLVAHLQLLVRNGELTERGLAQRIGASQPHIHNVIQGKRLASPALMDRILRGIGLRLADFLTPEQVAFQVQRQRGAPGQVQLVPLLKGRLSARHPPPVRSSFQEWIQLPPAAVQGARQPVFVIFTPDDGADASLRAARMALLDLDIAAKPVDGTQCWAAILWNGGTYVRPVRLLAGGVELLGQSGLLAQNLPGRLDWVTSPAEVLLGEVLWAGDDLRGFSPLPHAGTFLVSPTSS